MAFFDIPKQYIAVIGDIKDSKELEDRGSAQQVLQEFIDILNRDFADEIASNFTITLGDEFQGLLLTGESTLTVLLGSQYFLPSISFRFGIGIGEITTPINRELSIGADGPAYHRAREAIDTLKANESRKATADAFARIAFDKRNASTVDMMNAMLVLMTAIQQNWTARQQEMIAFMLATSSSQEELAKHLNVTQSTVQKSLATGHYYAYKQAYDLINNALGEIGRNHV